MSTLLHETSPTARRTHQCNLCLGPINPGQTYRYAAMADGGTVYSWRTCPACMDDRILSEVWDWAGSPDEGVLADEAEVWATETVEATSVAPELRTAARRFLDRFGTYTPPATA